MLMYMPNKKLNIIYMDGYLEIRLNDPYEVLLSTRLIHPDPASNYSTDKVIETDNSLSH